MCRSVCLSFSISVFVCGWQFANTQYGKYANIQLKSVRTSQMNDIESYEMCWLPIQFSIHFSFDVAFECPLSLCLSVFRTDCALSLSLSLGAFFNSMQLLQCEFTSLFHMLSIFREIERDLVSYFQMAAFVFLAMTTFITAFYINLLEFPIAI